MGRHLLESCKYILYERWPATLRLSSQEKESPGYQMDWLCEEIVKSSHFFQLYQMFSTVVKHMSKFTLTVDPPTPAIPADITYNHSKQTTQLSHSIFVTCVIVRKIKFFIYVIRLYNIFLHRNRQAEYII